MRIAKCESSIRISNLPEEKRESEREGRGTRLAQLDGLRGLAIIGVLVNHLTYLPGRLQCGWLGVNLFFVLSGFLITRILLDQREQMTTAGGGVLRSLRVFYARRALRIFPLFYLTLAVLWACNFERSRHFGWMLATYTYNIRIAFHGFTQSFDHFWSLCVEEQFYLIWPAVVLIVLPHKLGRFMAVAFLAAPVWRLGCMILGVQTRIPLYVPTIACLDCLAAGGLLAYFERNKEGWEWFLTRCRALGIALMLLWLTLSILTRTWLWHHVPVEWVFGNTAMAFFFAWVVGRAAEPRAGDWGALLRMKWLNYLGTISYSVYVLHKFSPFLWLKLEPFVKIVYIPAPLAHLVISILGGALSWHLLEKPIQSLKRFIPYAPSKPQDVSIPSESLPRAA
jgi:peptidoglycan/LPS O-acetylase OafA/YrhL